ncbi:hypothetical protein FS837_008114, partial [Tulasnella sp. UAMH 9824]
EYYLKPAGFTGSGRYEDHYRVHGRSIVVMDTWAERGIEIQAANPASVDEVVTLIKQRQYLDMTRGTLNGLKTLSRILINVEKMLEDPANMLILPFQKTKSFRALKTDNPDYIAVEDLREFVSRRGDVRPQYWIRISWLFTNWNLIHYVWGCSCIYDKIREGLYEAVPLIKNHPDVHEVPYRGNRFTITMGEPEVWHIKDRAVQKRSYLWNVQIYNCEFDVPRWYLFEFSIYDYDRKLFRHLTGVKPSRKKRGKYASAVERTEEPKQEGENDFDYKCDAARLRMRSPRIHSGGPNGSRGLSKTDQNKEPPHESNVDSDLPSLVNVSSSGVSDDEGSDVARTLNRGSSDEIMDDTPDWIDEPDEVATEEFDSAKHHASPPESTHLAPPSHATINMRPRTAFGPRERLRKNCPSTYSN